MLEAAARALGVPIAEVKAVNHEVVHAASGRRLGFANWAADAAAQPVPDIAGLKLKDPKDFRYIGKGQVSIVDLRDITPGARNMAATCGCREGSMPSSPVLPWSAEGGVVRTRRTP